MGAGGGNAVKTSLRGRVDKHESETPIIPLSCQFDTSKEKNEMHE